MNHSSQSPTDDSRSTAGTAAFTGTGSWQSGTEPRAAREPVSVAIAGYEVLGKLGRGGMGVVYQARQIKADRIVALKLMLHAEHADGAARARFDMEAQAVARLQHPNIVQVFEVGEANGVPFFSLEYVAGGTLADAIKQNLLPSRAVADLLATLAHAMAYGHRSNVIHRDLKPSNILLTPDGAPKIADFGLARKTENESHLTQAGMVVGTPSYMAPEQASGNPDTIGPAADVYSLGAILYELLTGRAPFVGQTMLEVLEQVRSSEPMPPSALQPRVPRDLETICLKCLQKDPVRRYESADALADDLDRYRRGEPIKARPIGRLARALRWCRRNPAPTAVVAVALLAAGIAAGAAWMIADQNDQITAQNNDIVAHSEKIKEQNAAILAKEQLASARLDVNRRLVTAFATEAPNITGRHPLAGEIQTDLVDLVIRLLGESQGKGDVGSMTEHGLIILATRRGDMARIQGRLDKAQDNYDEAHRLALLMVKNETAEPGKALSNLAFTFINFNELAMGRRRYAEAIRWLREALAIRRRLVENPPGNDLDPVDCHLDLGRLYILLAQAHFSAGELSKALPRAQQGLELLEKYAPAVTDARQAERAWLDTADAAIHLGNLAFRTDQYDLGRQVFLRAIALYRQQQASHPDSIAMRYNLSKVYSEFGDWCLMKLQSPGDALRYFNLAQQQNRALCDSHEVVNVQQMGLALGYYRLGLAAHRAGKAAEAQKYFARCLTLRAARVLEVEQSSHSRTARALMDARIDHMLVQARLGQVAEVLAMTDELRKLADSLKPLSARNIGETNDAKAHYQIFVGVGLAVLAEMLPANDPRRSDFMTRAIDAVRLAVANDFSNLWFLENDSDFDAIRPDARYTAVVDTLRQRLKKSH
jgi:serine/threonine-protein kinase